MSPARITPDGAHCFQGSLFLLKLSGISRRRLNCIMTVKIKRLRPRHQRLKMWSNRIFTQRTGSGFPFGFLHTPNLIAMAIETSKVSSSEFSRISRYSAAKRTRAGNSLKGIHFRPSPVSLTVQMNIMQAFYQMLLPVPRLYFFLTVPWQILLHLQLECRCEL